ncbi:MAG: DNA replication and repair protein RecF [Bacteroidaceae bacterium]|nr:DNA replication and repair protein RecF [Bacteroidaceae bacterium]
MILKNISIINYKNITGANLPLSPKFNCFVGNNGVGKTNLLDAIYYLSFCRSSSSQTNLHIIRHQQDSMMIQGIYLTPDNEELNIHCGLRLGRKKTFKKNGKEYKKLSEHIGLIPLVLVSPNDIDFIYGTGETRRKFIDTTISQYSTQYLQHLISYNQLLQQRNALLKSETPPDDTLLTTYDKIMSQHGSEIYNYRKEFIENFTPLFDNIYSQLGEKSESAGLVYQSHLSNNNLFEILQSHHQKDHIVGHTLKGTHRDDIEMTLNNYPIRYEGSQGQIKSFLTALRLAQYQYLKKTITTKKPLLLLDDIFDKLDSQRVERIIQIVSTNDYGQIFITSTNNDILQQVIAKSNHNYRFYTVNNGTYEES